MKAVPLLCLFALPPIQPGASSASKDPSDWVNVFIGTGATGNTFPGATLPFGMVQLTPMMAKSGWNYNSGYHRPGADGGQAAFSPLAGFGLTALSGTGLNDGGDFILLPQPAGSRRSATPQLDHASERALPGYYRCRVAWGQEDAEVQVELAAKLRSGILRASFSGSGKHAILLDMNSPQDQLEENSVERRSSTLFVASRASQHTHHCATDHIAYVAIETSLDIASLEQVAPGKWRVEFDAAATEVSLRIGFSHVDEDGAEQNLRAELGGSGAAADGVAAAAIAADFEGVAADGRQAWDDALGRASVEGDDDVVARFYSALYHVLLGPTLFSDVDRRYRFGGRGSIAQADFDVYSTFSLWDTYRAEHPLLNLLFPELAGHFARSLLAMRRDSGKLPRWALYGRETGCMIGYPAAIVLSEAALKGLLVGPHEDGPEGPVGAGSTLEAAALRAAVGSSNAAEGGRGLDKLIPVPHDEWAGVSKALEYAWADACISKLASRLGDSKKAGHYMSRSQLYRVNFDPESKLLLPRRCRRGQPCPVGQQAPRGAFTRLPASVYTEQTGRFYTEGTPLQYTFMVPHDLPGLTDLLGSKASLQDSLDTYFERSTFAEVTGQRDLETGHLGGHVQGNEPGHHIPYLYNFAGAPWKTQAVVDKLLAMYKNSSEGLPGNDDVGQMSAWFALSALGLYPVDPCDGEYAIGRPLVRRAKLKLQHGTVTIIAYNQSLLNKHVQSLSWNGAPLAKFDIPHAELVRGGELFFWMSDAKVDFRNTPLPPCRAQAAVHEGRGALPALPCICDDRVCFQDERGEGGEQPAFSSHSASLLEPVPAPALRAFREVAGAPVEGEGVAAAAAGAAADAEAEALGVEGSYVWFGLLPVALLTARCCLFRKPLQNKSQ